MEDKKQVRQVSRAKQVYDLILTHPGITMIQLAKAVGKSRGSMQANLATLENHGWLVYEEDGKLYPYERIEDDKSP